MKYILLGIVILGAMRFIIPVVLGIIGGIRKEGDADKK